jgi:hypothetical protein
MAKNDKKGMMLKDMFFRAAEFERGENGVPATLDEETRSVNVIAATENPVTVFDWERWEPILEVLLMSGCKLHGARQLPFLGEHYRWNQSLENVIGSCRELEIKDGKLIGRAQFSSCEEAEKPYTKVREGHVTDVSIGYRVTKAVRIPKGETGIVDGRSFKGPIRVATEWTPTELTLCPIGADQASKIRAAMIPGDSGIEIEELPPETAADTNTNHTGGNREMDEKEVQQRVDDAVRASNEQGKTAMKKVFDRAAAAGQEALAFRLFAEGKTEDEITDAIIAAQAKERGKPGDGGEGQDPGKPGARKLDEIDDDTFVRSITEPTLMVLD